MSTHSCLRDSVFFYIDPPPTEIYTLSLHDALPRGRVTLRAAQLARGPRPDVQLLPGDHDAQEQLRFRDHQPGRGRVHQAGDEAGGREAVRLDQRLEDLAGRALTAPPTAG